MSRNVSSQTQLILALERERGCTYEWGVREIISSQGYLLVPLQLPDSIRELVKARNWVALDQAVGREVVKGGVIFEELKKYGEFSQIEFIISIRSSMEEPDEDGIWHDDGSRVLAFSLSLCLNPEEIEGGRLELRKRGEDETVLASLPSPPFGTMIVFATGWQGFEHKINRVSSGERIIIAGWCT